MRLIDADKLRLSYWVSPTSTVSTAGQYYFYSQNEVDNAPTIDAEPVIRCKDCKWFAINGIEGATMDGKPIRYAVCTHYYGMRGITVYSYCSKAERKDE